jgi:putative transposase
MASCAAVANPMSLSFGERERLYKTFHLRYVVCMNTSELPVLLSLYAQIAPGELFRLLQRGLGVTKHEGIYTPRVVIWMMMLQRLDGRGTLASTVEQLALGRFDPLLSRCKRVRERNIALSTGGYCQARQNLPKMLMDRSVDEILQRLRNHLIERLPLLERPVYVLDGSSLQLDHCPELEQAYPSARNPRRPSHWPVLRIAVLHDVETGLAQEPCWGPMYGPQAVSEQALAERALNPLPPGAVLIGDRNFGIFAIAHSAHQKGHQVVIRLTSQRAKRLVDAPLRQQGVHPVEWKASSREQAKHGKLSTDAIQGRLVVWRVGRGKSKQWLYLFTTLTIAPDEVVALYGKRWHIETDLRSLKQTVRLNRLSVQSVDMMEKELLAAVLAYNLVRAIMCLAARQAGISTRQLSFTYAHNIVQDGILSVLAAPTLVEQVKRMERIVDLVARCKLPNRTKRRSFPREVWGHGRAFPSRKGKTK